MNKRINIMLPERTLAVLDRVAPRGNRSRFVSAAVLHYVETQAGRACAGSSKPAIWPMPAKI